MKFAYAWSIVVDSIHSLLIFKMRENSKMQRTPESKIFDNIKESAWISQAAKKNHEADISTNLLAWPTSESLAFPLHSLDHSTEVRKPKSELREKLIAVIFPVLLIESSEPQG